MEHYYEEDSATYCGWNKLVLKLGNVKFVPPVDQMKEGNGKGKQRKLERIQEEERNFEEYFRSMRDLRVATEPEETVEEEEEPWEKWVNRDGEEDEEYDKVEEADEGWETQGKVWGIYLPLARGVAGYGAPKT